MKEKKYLKIICLLFTGLLPAVFTAQNNAVILNGTYIILTGGTAASNVYMVVDQSNTAGIVRNAGHINSEGQYNFVKWNTGTGTGNYVFPFGVGATATDYIPFTFNKTTAANSDIGMSTWTTNPLNMPHPAATNVAAVSNMTGIPDSVNNAIDRFWDIQSPSVTGDLTFSYRGIENTTLVPTDTFKAQHWNGTAWDLQAGPGNPGVTAGIGSVGPIPGQNTFSPWVLTRINLKATVASTQNSVCAGQCTGTATVTPLYGVSTYTYLWSDGQTTPVAVGLCAGVHTVTVTDAALAITTATVNISSNALPLVTANSPVMCAGTTSTLTASGATTYSWSPAGGLGATTGATVTATPTTTNSYTVTGIDGNGCQDTAQVTVTVNALPVVTASSATICTGQSTVLSASGGNTYTWSANAGGATTNTVFVTPPTGITIYTVTGESTTNCTNTTTVSVTASALPSITASASNPGVCSGQSTLLTASGATNYTWSPNAGSAATNTVSVSPTVNTTYTVTGDIAGCISTQTVNVTITPTPTISVSAATPTLCSGQSTIITASGATTFTWSTNAGSATTNTVSVSPISNTTYTVTGDTVGCISTQTISVNVNPNPTVTASASTSTVCSGQNTILTGGGAMNYTWSANAGSAITNTVSVSPINNATYTVIGDSLGCQSTQTVAVNVNVLPGVSANASTGTACTGQAPVILTGSGATTYTWSANAGSATTNTVSVTPGAGTITYTVTGTTNGCDSTAQVTILINQTPTLTINSSAPAICVGQSSTLTGAGATNYTWMPGGTTTPTLSANPGTNSTYTVTGETGGCIATQTVNVTVNQNPIITGVAIADTAKCGVSNGTILGLSASGGTPGYSYQWIDTAGNIVGTSANLTGVSLGTYSLIVTDANTCKDTSNAGILVPGTGAVTAAITPPLSQGTATLDVTFTNNSTGASVYGWNFGNGTSSSQQIPGTITYTIPGTYKVTLIASSGTCMDTAYAVVIVDVPSTIIIPNIFTPNGDGINDEFFITTVGIKTLHCDIFNRWGQLVFSLFATDQKWDGILSNGNKATDGTYYYILDATGLDGKTYSAKGALTLIK